VVNVTIREVFIPTLAHGALGPFDELFAVLIFGIFAVMLLAPIVRAWMANDEESEEGLENSLEKGLENIAPFEASPEAPQQDNTTQTTDSHYRLN
jgi:ABC-type phosphate transport system permease subunit